MNAAVLLSALRAEGIRILPLDGFQRLCLEVPRKLLTNELVQSVRAHKSALLEELRAGGTPSSLEAEAIAKLSKVWPESIRDRYRERAGIIEFDGGLSRSDSERLAFEQHGRPLDRAALCVVRTFEGKIIESPTDTTAGNSKQKANS